MSIDETKREAWAAMQAKNRGIGTDEPTLPLFGGGGGGTYGGMEARIAVLEAHMENVRDEIRKLANVPADLATLKEKLEHVPTKTDLHSLESELTKKMQIYLGLVGALIVICATVAKLL